MLIQPNTTQVGIKLSALPVIHPKNKIVHTNNTIAINSTSYNNGFNAGKQIDSLLGATLQSDQIESPKINK
jgi:hypothetical protein